jgi:hypothetical protein
MQKNTIIALRCFFIYHESRCIGKNTTFSVDISVLGLQMTHIICPISKSVSAHRANNRFPSCLLLTWRFKAVSYPKTLLHSLPLNSLMAPVWFVKHMHTSTCRSTCDLNSFFDWKPCWHWPHVYMVVSWSLAWWSFNPWIDLYRFPHLSHTWESTNRHNFNAKYFRRKYIFCLCEWIH